MELGQSVDFGEELAETDVRYVVVVNSLSPYGSPATTSTGDLVAALNRQPDLDLVIRQSGFDVYTDQTLPESIKPQNWAVSPERLSLAIVQVIAWIAVVLYLTGWRRRLLEHRRNRLSSSESQPALSPDVAGVGSGADGPDAAARGGAGETVDAGDAGNAGDAVDAGGEIARTHTADAADAGDTSFGPVGTADVDPSSSKASQP
jgi:hypothetical protein